MGEAKRRGTPEQRRMIAILTDQAEGQEGALRGMMYLLGRETGARCWLQICFTAARAKKFFTKGWYQEARADRRMQVGVSLLAERRVRG